MIKRHGRYDHSSIVSRSDYNWPNGTRLAVYVALNVEVFSYGEGKGAGVAPPEQAKSDSVYSWRDYGNRVGIWRLFDLFDALNIPIEAQMNSAIYDEWPDIAFEMGPDVKRVNVDSITSKDVADWKSGDTLLLSGKLLTGRDAAHQRLSELIQHGEPLPVDFKNRFIYYVGPVDPVGAEVVGPAGPTTATRMDKFVGEMLDKTGLLGMIGKAERGDLAIEAIRNFGAVSLIAVGGAAYLVSKACLLYTSDAADE